MAGEDTGEINKVDKIVLGGSEFPKFPKENPKGKRIGNVFEKETKGTEADIPGRVFEERVPLDSQPEPGVEGRVKK